MAWTIESYRGANGVHFGMTADDVEAHLGTPRGVHTKAGGRFSEFRGTAMPVVEYRNSGVDELIFSTRCTEVLFRGFSVFAAPGRSALERLITLGGDLVELPGGAILSVSLGISLSGYLDEDASNKSFGAFSRGVWDQVLPSARKLIL